MSEIPQAWVLSVSTGTRAGISLARFDAGVQDPHPQQTVLGSFRLVPVCTLSVDTQALAPTLHFALSTHLTGTLETAGPFAHIPLVLVLECARGLESAQLLAMGKALAVCQLFAGQPGAELRLQVPPGCPSSLVQRTVPLAVLHTVGLVSRVGARWDGPAILATQSLWLWALRWARGELTLKV